MLVSELHRQILIQFLRYYDTPFSLRSPSLSKERRIALESAAQVAQEPVIEAIPRYASSPHSLEELVLHLDPQTEIYELRALRSIHPGKAVRASGGGADKCARFTRSAEIGYWLGKD